MTSPPSKKIKHANHDAPSMSPRDPVKYEHTPPPSPGADGDEPECDDVTPKEIDLEGINDEIVKGVIIDRKSVV